MGFTHVIPGSVEFPSNGFPLLVSCILLSAPGVAEGVSSLLVTGIVS